MEALAYGKDVQARHDCQVVSLSGGVPSQKRFCSCGRAIYVQFVPSGSGFAPLFRFSAFSRSVIVHECPSCGKELDIDVVR